MGWINSRQQNRDHTGKRGLCSACGRGFTAADPAVNDDEGWRVHRSHTTDPDSGMFGREQK